MLIALLLAASAPGFDPMRFFSGETRGEGRLKILLRAVKSVAVHGSGRIEADGTLVLDQVVSQGEKLPRTRQWRLRQVSPGRYTGSLTDASGPVLGEVDGPRLHLSFTSSDGFRVQQWLTLARDARSASNHLEARRFGVVVATLDETITKVD